MDVFATFGARYYGPWHILVSIRAVCPDGQIRRVTLTREADTFYTQPARLVYRDKTVTGYIMIHDAHTEEPYVQFTPTGRNAGVFDVKCETGA